jgi:ribosomal protein S15P/S13E
MARAGLLVRAGKRRCAVTGCMVWAWDVTDNFPTKEALRKATIRPPRYTIDASKNEEIAILTKQVKTLTEQVEQQVRIIQAKKGLCDTLVIIIDAQRAKLVELETAIENTPGGKKGKKFQKWSAEVLSAQQTHLPGI